MGRDESMSKFIALRKRPRTAQFGLEEMSSEDKRLRILQEVPTDEQVDALERIGPPAAFLERISERLFFTFVAGKSTGAIFEYGSKHTNFGSTFFFLLNSLKFFSVKACVICFARSVL